MFYVSAPSDQPPAQFKTPLQTRVYSTLHELGIPFVRVDTDEAITMEDCVQIDAVLGVKIVKTLFLCNRQQSAFYLFVTDPDKPFRSKDFSAALHVSRVSFAPQEKMQELLGTKVGAATVFSTLLDTCGDVRIVLDRDTLKNEWYGCSDGTTTSYMRLKTSDLLERFLPYTKHRPVLLSL